MTLLQVEALLAQLRSILRRSRWRWSTSCCSCWRLAWPCSSPVCKRHWTSASASALLRALGAERRLLLSARRAEFGLLGAASGLLAALGCELVSALLYHYAFDLRWQPHPWLLVLPLIGALLVVARD